MLPYRNDITLRAVLRYVLLVGILTWATVQALAWTTLYSSEHAYRQASEWIFHTVPKGSNLLGVHWDDKLPVSLPGFDPHSNTYQYDYEGPESDLPLYERDTPEKLDDVVKRLAKADYFILPTQRLQGSLMRVPDEFPDTNAFFQLLFGNHLGFELVQTVKVRPAFAWMTIFTDIADESLSVYDHPKISIFKNVGHLPKAELKRRILSPDEFTPRPGLKEVMLMDAGDPALSGATTSPTQLVVQVGAFVTWGLLVSILGWLVFPILYTVLPSLIDRGYGISRTVGFVIFGVVSWALNSTQVITFHPQAYWAILLLMGACSAVSYCRIGGVKRCVQTLKKEIIRVEILFWFGFALFAFIRACQPEIFWGEKPMDSTFLNYFLRTEELPPQDPWVAGRYMSYYYLGFYFFSLLIKLTGVSSAIAYNLALATIGGLLISATYTLLRTLTRSTTRATYGALFLTLLGNLEGVRLAVIEGKKLNFDWYWATSRVLESSGINEYPLWSLIFADLHPHVMALPVTISLLALSIPLVRSVGQWEWKTSVLCLLYGLMLGTLAGLNVWDVIAYGIFSVLLFLVRADLLSRAVPAGERALGFVIKRSVQDAVALGFFAIPLSAFFALNRTSAQELGWGWVVTPEFNSISNVIRHLGFWWYVIFASLLVLTCEWKIRISNYEKLIFPVAVAALPIVMGIASMSRGNSVPWSILVPASVLVFFGGCLADQATVSVTKRVTGMFLVTIGLIISGAEMFYFIDRMNTLFKFYYPLWVLSAIAAVVLAPSLFWWTKGYAQNPMWLRITRVTGTVGALLLFSCCFFSSVAIIFVMANFSRVDGPRFTLDGRAYLAEQDRDEANLIQWINKNISGAPVLLEAQGDSYREFTRISMHTGLPVVLGWEHHVKQRGTSQFEVDVRRAAVRNMYEGTDLAQLKQLLLNYHVRYVVVSKVERATYLAAGLEKFKTHPELFRPIFKAGDSVLYEVQRL